MRKHLRRIAIVVGAMVLAWLMAALVLDVYGRRETPLGRYDAIIVSGARVRHGGAPSRSLERRAQRAAELYAQGLAPRIVLTGGNVGDRLREVAAVAAFATVEAFHSVKGDSRL